MAMENASSYIKVAQSLSPLSVASGGATETAVDCRGFSRVCHILNVGTMGGATAAVYSSVWECATSGGTYTYITGTKTTIANSAGASEPYLMEVPVNVAKPYQKMITTAGTSWSEVSGVALLFGGSNTMPPSQTNTVVSV